MKRLDLIIDALESCKETSWSMTFDAESVQEALAAARELREMEPVGIRYNYFGFTTKAFDEELFKRLQKIPDSTPQKLYALGGEK